MESYPIKSVGDEFDDIPEIIHEIIQWGRLCKHLSVDKEVQEEIEYSWKSDCEKKLYCMVEYNNHNSNWRRVAYVVCDFPIENSHFTYKIVKKYMMMEKEVFTYFLIHEYGM